MKSKRVLSLTLIMAMISANVVFADQVVTNRKSYSQAENSITVNKVTGEVTYPSLTIEEATTKAIANSSNIKNLTESRDEYQTTTDSTTFAFEYTNNVSSTSANQQMAYSIRQLNNALRQIDLTKSAAEDGVRLNVKKLFNSIKAAQDQIKLYEQNMVIQEKDIKIAEVKKNIGLMSDLEYNNTVNTYNTTVSSKTDLEIAVDEAFRSLNDAMGTDLNLQYNLVLDDVTMENIGDVDLNAAINKAVASNYNLKILKDNLDLAKYDYKTYVPTYSDVGLNEKKRNAVSSAQRALNDAESTLRTNMTTIYNNIISAEQKYVDTKGQLDVLKNQLEVVKTQNASGQATDIAVLNVEYNIAQAEAGLDQIARGHELLVEQFNNPDLIQ